MAEHEGDTSSHLWSSHGPCEGHLCPVFYVWPEILHITSSSKCETLYPVTRASDMGLAVRERISQLTSWGCFLSSHLSLKHESVVTLLRC